VTHNNTPANQQACREQFAVVISDPSQVAEARRLATRLATEIGFQATEIGKVALLVTEAATNLLKHAVGGQLLIRQLEGATESGLEILALDKGPGIRNLSACLRDGYSTAGSAGTGLGAITRVASFWDIYSLEGQGTAFLIHISKAISFQTAPWTASPSPAPHFQIGGLCMPKSGEPVSGDVWAVEQQGSRCVMMVSDGLGHGQLAAEASWEARRILHKHWSYAPAEILGTMHAALGKTRGAAVAIAEIDARQQHVVFAGVGNIAGHIIMAEKTHHLVSSNGIVGHQVRKIQAFTYPWWAGALLVLHSDGLLSRWSLDAYPGLPARHASLIAGVLYRDFPRCRDDVTVVVAKTAHIT
jgi:anti-sigma regulatory factor (Ser/Thr protein kinase)